MEVILGILLVLLAGAAASAAAVALVVWLVVRRIRRSARVNTAALRARATVTPGPRRAVYVQRVRLREALRSGRAAVDLASEHRVRHGELPRLFRRLEAEADALETQLRLMESETARPALTAQLRAATTRVDDIVDLVHRLRESIALELAEPGGERLDELRAEFDREITALRAGILELRGLHDPAPTARTTTTLPAERLQTRGAPS